jgi:hypothetical protein
MGYTTQFQGKVKITPELTAPQIRFIKGFYGDMREWNPDEHKRTGLMWFQWELNDNLDALQWDENEKFYDADKCMEYIIEKTTEKYPELNFNGIIQAQGEEFDDRWQLIVKNNKVTRKDVKIVGQKITCPHCEEDFILED